MGVMPLRPVVPPRTGPHGRAHQRVLVGEEDICGGREAPPRPTWSIVAIGKHKQGAPRGADALDATAAGAAARAFWGG